MDLPSRHTVVVLNRAGDDDDDGGDNGRPRRSRTRDIQQRAIDLLSPSRSPSASSQSTSASTSPLPPSECTQTGLSSNFWSALTSRASGQRSRRVGHTSGAVEPECCVATDQSQDVELTSAEQQQQQQQQRQRYDKEESERVGARNKGSKNKSKNKKSKRSESIQVELDRIEMHERLLLNGQRQLMDKCLESGGEGAQKWPTGADSDAGNSVINGAQLSAAIECRNVTYTAGLGSFQKTILHNVSLTVPEGCIYGLLGPSGCGKTTLLRCLAGRLQPELGTIRVFGYKPNEAASQIPGQAIGYMPQEVSVYEDFTINETLTYFGRINRMRSSLLVARIAFLLKFLNLPDKGRLIKTLSGGQRRRVSLAVALVHSPPLLVLDEPTVGVDPLLRQIIWRYLVTLASSDKITIIITTHYIEEARQANIVGLMRSGRLLAENTPGELMSSFRMSSLESVFLKLCIMLDHQQEAAAAATAATKQTYKKTNEKASADSEAAIVFLKPDLRPTTPDDCCPASSESAGLAAGHLAPATPVSETDRALAVVGLDSIASRLQYKSMEAGQKYTGKPVNAKIWLSILAAVTWKNYLRLRRNPPVLVFEFLLPALQLILFCLCIGGQPFDIKLAVVNEELIPQASRLFLDSLSKTTFRQVPYTTLPEARQSVRLGHTWAAVHIPAGYTRNLNDRLLHPADVSNDTLLNGTINIYPDLTNLHLALTIEGAFREAFIKFTRDTLDMLGYDPQLAELPIKLAEPIYGGTGSGGGSGYLEFMAPGVVISIVYVMATGLTALAFILEKRDGLLERSQISGVTTSQILLAHALLQVFVMIFQVALVLAVTFYLFSVPSNGPFVWVVVLILLQGCTGMAFGLLISAICREENAAIMMLVGTFYINLILAGIIWPVEAMPKWLRLLSYAQPQTMPIESLRNILSRGWPISESSVYLGFVITIGWLLVFLVGAGLCMRYIK